MRPTAVGAGAEIAVSYCNLNKCCLPCATPKTLHLTLHLTLVKCRELDQRRLCAVKLMSNHRQITGFLEVMSELTS